MLAEFGDDPTHYVSAKARKNYAGTSPITRASGKSHAVQARYVRNNRLVGILHGCLKTRTLYGKQPTGHITSKPTPLDAQTTRGV